jgi:hypothetical protein
MMSCEVAPQWTYTARARAPASRRGIPGPAPGPPRRFARSRRQRGGVDLDLEAGAVDRLGPRPRGSGPPRPAPWRTRPRRSAWRDLGGVGEELRRVGIGEEIAVDPAVVDAGGHVRRRGARGCRAPRPRWRRGAHASRRSRPRGGPARRWRARASRRSRRMIVLQPGAAMAAGGDAPFVDQDLARADAGGAPFRVGGEALQRLDVEVEDRRGRRASRSSRPSRTARRAAGQPPVGGHLHRPGRCG